MAWALVWAGTVSRATRNQTGRVQAGSAPKGPKQSEGRQSRCRFSALPFDFRDARAGKPSPALKALNGGRQTLAKTVTQPLAPIRRHAAPLPYQPAPASKTQQSRQGRACAVRAGPMKLQSQSMGWLARYRWRRSPVLMPEAYWVLEDLRALAPNPMVLASFERAAL